MSQPISLRITTASRNATKDDRRDDHDHDDGVGPTVLPLGRGGAGSRARRAGPGVTASIAASRSGPGPGWRRAWPSGRRSGRNRPVDPARRVPTTTSSGDAVPSGRHRRTGAGNRQQRQQRGHRVAAVVSGVLVVVCSEAGDLVGGLVGLRARGRDPRRSSSSAPVSSTCSSRRPGGRPRRTRGRGRGPSSRSWAGRAGVAACGAAGAPGPAGAPRASRARRVVEGPRRRGSRGPWSSLTVPPPYVTQGRSRTRDVPWRAWRALRRR